MTTLKYKEQQEREAIWDRLGWVPTSVLKSIAPPKIVSKHPEESLSSGSVAAWQRVASLWCVAAEIGGKVGTQIAAPDTTLD